jgi:predicted N-formylglutamate amidohydrolase
MPEISDAIVIPGNQGLSETERNERIRCLFTPYRKAIDGVLHDFHQRGICPALIAIHSFTPRMNGFERPWHIGILWDKDPRIPLPLMEKLRQRPEGIVVGDNEPYSGRHPADYTIDHHAETRGIPHVSIEVRQDLISDDEGVEHWALLLHKALDEILADPGIYSVWQYV